MLHRQKALLEILQQVGGEASTLQMMKWAFLLSQETVSHGGKTFYHFLPYHFGPYSFTLNRETDTLIRNGFVKKIDKNTWALTQIGQEQPSSLQKKITQDIASVTKQYGNLSGSALIETVYSQYPWFTVNSDLPGRRKARRPKAKKAIYTVGYEGRTVDEFLNLLMESGIYRIIDVRYNPISRRYGFHKSTLAKLCGSLNIDYQHLPGLGIPGSARTNLDSAASYVELFKEYRCGLLNRMGDLQTATELLSSEASALMCMEANPEFCHRNVLSHHLKEMVNLPVKHLGHKE